MDTHPVISAPSAFRFHDKDTEELTSVHVNDCTTASFNKSAIPKSHFEEGIKQFFDFSKKDLTSWSRLLGFDILHDANSSTIKLSVKTKVSGIASRYNMADAHSVRTPMVENALASFETHQADDDDDEQSQFPYAQLIGELLWIAMNARPDITFAVVTLSRYLKDPKSCHWTAAKRVVRYLIGSQDLALTYSLSPGTMPMGYSDSDWARNPLDRKSISGLVFIHAGAAITWKVRRQQSVATSSAEAEYLALSLAARESLWLRHFFSEIGRPFPGPSTIYSDNQAAISMTKNPVYVSKTKHIDISAHHVRDECSKGSIQVIYIAGSDNPADIMTKPLSPANHEKCVRSLGLN